MNPRKLSVTLVEPAYPVNLGHVARLMKNFGLVNLNLVRPRVDLAVATVYAAHGADVLEGARRTTLARVRKETDLMVATTAVRARKQSNVTRQATSPEAMARRLAAARSASIVIGRDTTGLTNSEIEMCDMTVVVETGSNYRTLNLSHAAAILLYVASRAMTGGRKMAERKTRQVFADRLAELAMASRMPRHKTAGVRARAIKLASSAELTERQLLMLSGIFRKATATIRKAQALDSKA
jgi:tRNA/rRNA methyltransferase